MDLLHTLLSMVPFWKTAHPGKVLATFLELGGTSHRILMGEATSILASSLSSTLLVLTSKELGLCCLQGQGRTGFLNVLGCCRSLRAFP